MVYKTLYFEVTLYTYLFSLLGFSQTDSNIINLKLNDARPHYSLKYMPGNKVIFTSYLLAKNGKVKKGMEILLLLFLKVIYQFMEK